MQGMQEFEASSEEALTLVINLMGQGWFASAPKVADFPQPVLVLRKGDSRIVIERIGRDLWLFTSI